MKIGLANILTPEQGHVYKQLMEADPFRDEKEALEMVLTYVVADIDTPERFAVTDMSSANWVMKKLAECDADEAEVTAMIEAEIEAIEERGKKILKPIRNRREFFTTVYSSQLVEWVKDKLEGQKAKSVNFIHGIAGFRKQPDKFVIDDEQKAIEWSETYCPEAVKKSILTVPLKAMESFDIAGFAHTELGTETFYIKAELPGEGK
jgi:hypothetical protein